MTNITKITGNVLDIESRKRSAEAPRNKAGHVESSQSIPADKHSVSSASEAQFRDLLYDANMQSKVSADINLKDIIEQLSHESAENLIAKQPSEAIIELSKIVRTDKN